MKVRLRKKKGLFHPLIKNLPKPFRYQIEGAFVRRDNKVIYSVSLVHPEKIPLSVKDYTYTILRYLAQRLFQRERLPDTHGYSVSFAFSTPSPTRIKPAYSNPRPIPNSLKRIASYSSLQDTDVFTSLEEYTDSLANSIRMKSVIQ